MTAKTDAWMPLWIGAYLADTQHLTRDEHGGYFLLLMAYWRARVALPDDDKRLASIVKATPAEWKRLRPTMAEFFKIDAGAWWHKRVEAEIESADKRKAGAIAKAQAGGQALAEKRRKQGAETASSSATGSASSTRQALLGQCPTPSPLPSEEEKKAPPVLVALRGDVYAVPDCPYDGILRAYHEVLPMLPAVVVWNAARRASVRARWVEVCAAEKFDAERGSQWFRDFFASVARSAFLTGRGKNGWKADLEWLMGPKNFAKAVEGRYDQERA